MSAINHCVLSVRALRPKGLQQRPDVNQRIRPRRDTGEVEEPVEAVDDAVAGKADRWAAFGLGCALMELRSINEGVVRMALGKLHIRSFRTSAQKMKKLLSAAGCLKK